MKVRAWGLTIAAGMMLAPTAIAEELLPVLDTPDGIGQYVEARSIVQRGDKTEYVVRTKFANTAIQGLSLVVTRMEGNCESGEIRTQQAIAYDVKGVEIAKREFSGTGLSVGKVKPGSPEEAALILACSYSPPANVSR